jgi:putative transposase
MARPLRIEFPGAVYHVTSRGDRREPIYRDDVDRLSQLAVLAQAMDRFDAQVLAYCLMGNHYHLVLYTRAANLSRLMRQVNGVYTQAFNRRHGLVGHLFQGRFKALIVDRDAYLLALCRYVERNPVAAGLVGAASQWQWSSCRAHVGLTQTPAWLDRDGLHGSVLGRAVTTPRDRRLAEQRYAALVGQAPADESRFWQDTLRGQIYLGDEAFVERMQSKLGPQHRHAREIPRRQRSVPLAWSQWLLRAEGDRNVALLMAYRQGGWTMTALAAEAGLSVSHVARLIARGERGAIGEREGK